MSETFFIQNLSRHFYLAVVGLGVRLVHLVREPLEGGERLLFAGQLLCCGPRIQLFRFVDGVESGGNVAERQATLGDANVALGERWVQLNGLPGVLKGVGELSEHHSASGSIAVVGDASWAKLDGP